MRVSWLDLKLGIRMLAKYRWLSSVAVIGMALAIAIGAAYFSIVGMTLDATLPVTGGNRVVAIEVRTTTGPDIGRREGVPLDDFVQWRSELKSISDLGAYRDESRNLITVDGRTDLVKVAAITASAFRLMHTSPLLGRALLEEDERPGAAPVLVIGYERWRREFDGDPRVIGTEVRLDGTVHTIVGVMPDGFLFPFRHHYWVPLQPADAAPKPDVARVTAFGRIADGLSLTDARAELATVGERMAQVFPQTHGNVRPYTLPYTQAFAGVEGPGAQRVIRSLQLGAGILLLIVAVNVAILVYARTATRTSEIVVRTALGASRGRVVSQLFVEALVLTTGAVVLGLGIVAVAFRSIRELVKHAPQIERIPYWFQPALSVWAVAYVVLFSVIAAIVIGVVPALKATGRSVQARLQQFSPRGSGAALGRLWTALIVAQVAVAVAILPAAIHNAQDAFTLARRAPAPAANDMLRGTLTTPSSGVVTRLMQQLEAEPDVAAATFAQDFPGRERYASIDAEGSGEILASSTRVAPQLFQVFGIPILAGRGFSTADTLPGATAVIVDQTLAGTLSAGGQVVGRRIRYLQRRDDGNLGFGPWLEIVGVVPAFATSFTAPSPFGTPPPRFYHAAAPGGTDTTVVVVRVRGGDPRRFVERMRAVGTFVDPALKIQDLMSAAEVWNYEMQAPAIVVSVILAVTGSVLLLSAAGIYSMMSFTVTSRRREIGIRAALGADARRVLASIFARASAQLGAGVTLGLLAAAGLDAASGGGMLGGRGLVLLPGVVALMFTVGLLAALGPARRGLAVQPTDALREE